MREYVFDGPAMADYCPLVFADMSQATIIRGAALSEEQYEKLSDDTKDHVKNWVRAGVITMRGDEPQEQSRRTRGKE